MSQQDRSHAGLFIQISNRKVSGEPQSAQRSGLIAFLSQGSSVHPVQTPPTRSPPASFNLLAPALSFCPCAFPAPPARPCFVPPWPRRGAAGLRLRSAGDVRRDGAAL